jgi:hypothetical protein
MVLRSLTVVAQSARALVARGIRQAAVGGGSDPTEGATMRAFALSPRSKPCRSHPAGRIFGISGACSWNQLIAVPNLLTPAGAIVIAAGPSIFRREQMRGQSRSTSLIHFSRATMIGRYRTTRPRVARAGRMTRHARLVSSRDPGRCAPGQGWSTCRSRPAPARQ